MSLTAVPVYNPLYLDNKVYEFSNRHLPFLEINNAQYKARHITFTKVIFDSLIHFNECDLKIGLQFEDCTFKEGIQFTNIKAQGIDLMLNPDSQNLVFKGCVFNGKILFDGKKSKIERSVTFEKCTLYDGLTIQSLNIELESLEIKNCQIEKDLDLFDISVKQELRLSDNTVNNLTRIEGAKCGMLNVLDNTFSNCFFVRHSTFENSISFNQGVFKDLVTLNQVLTIKQGITIYESIFEKSVAINYNNKETKNETGILSYYIDSAKFNNGITIDGTHGKVAEYPRVDTVMINISAELKGNITFRDLEIGTLNLTGYNTLSNITFQRIYINEINIDSLMNQAGLIFSDVKGSYKTWHTKDVDPVREKPNTIHINNSNLGKAQFYQFDFTTFKTISFHNNIFTEISTSLINWFTNEQLNTGIERLSIDVFKKSKKEKGPFSQNHRRLLIQVYKSKQEIYRQLKFASQKQGDVAQSLDFQRNEMAYYRKVTKYTKPRNWSEHFTLSTNRSNDFGQNWLKALGFLLLFSILSYIPIGFLSSDNLDYSRFADSWYDIKINLRIIFYDNFKSWIVILNPTHRLDDIDVNLEKHSKWIYFWDLLSRIIVGYFIYQLISAFRKFSK